MQNVMDDTTIAPAATAWCDDSTSAAAVYGDISTWDTSRVTTMAGLFSEQTTCNPNVKSWDVSNVTDFSGMFFKAGAFNQGPWRATPCRCTAPLRAAAAPRPRAPHAAPSRHHA